MGSQTEIEAERTLCLRVHIEDVGQNQVSRFVLPDPRIASKVEEIQPGRKANLVMNQATIGAQTDRRVSISMVRQIRLIRLLYPQRHRLSNQLLEFDTAGS